VKILTLIKLSKISKTFLVLCLLGIFQSCQLQKIHETSKQFKHIKIACQRNAPTCLTLIHDAYKEVTDPSLRADLLLMASLAYLKRGQQRVAASSFLSLLEMIEGDDPKICDYFDSVISELQRTHHWGFMIDVMKGDPLSDHFWKHHDRCYTTVWFYYAKALSRQGKYQASEAILKEKVNLKPNAEFQDLSLYLSAKNDYFQMGYDQCVDKLSSYQKKKPSSYTQASMMVLLSSCLVHEEHYYEAEALLERLACCPTLIDLKVVNQKKAMIKKRIAKIRKRL